MRGVAKRDEALPAVDLRQKAVTGEVLLSEAELAQVRRRKIETLRTEAQLSARENDLSTVQRLNELLADGVDALAGAVTLNRVFDEVDNAKGLNEAAKALQSLKAMRDDMIDRCMDEGDAGRGKRGIKINVEFAGQGVQLSVGK